MPQPKPMLVVAGPSGPPPPPPPPPPLPSRSAVTPALPRPTKPLPPAGSIGIGIETEFYLKPRNQEDDEKTLKLFGSKVEKAYNSSVSQDHPRMHSEIGRAYLGELHQEWSLAEDPTVKNGNCSPWGVENISPILNVSPGSGWRNHVARMWEFLDENYEVTGNDACGTHVHISIAEGYSVTQLKSIAQSVIHFEPAFEAMVPPDRRGNEYARSNWIDNKHFGYARKTRAQSIALIEECTQIREIVELMCPEISKYWGWNFSNLVKDAKYTIEFRRGAVSTTVDDVFVWVELAMSFVQAAIKVESPDYLRKRPNTVQGLRDFLNQGLILKDGMNDNRYLDLLFKDKDPKASLEPKAVGKLSPEKAAKLKKKTEEDAKINLMLSKLEQGNAWIK